VHVIPSGAVRARAKEPVVATVVDRDRGMTARRRIRVQADGYGCHLELTIEVTEGTTPQELERALSLLAVQARQQAAEEPAPC